VAVARPRTQLGLAVIGAVLATLVTGALNTSPATRLIGAALGAAITVLVASGGAQGLMLSLFIAGGALFFTYGGFTLFDYAANKEETFPLPAAMPNPQNGGQAIETTEGETTKGGLSLKWTPETVRCSSDGCDEVTVTSTGDERLEIGLLEFIGEAAAEFGFGGGDCEENNLEKGEKCHVSVSFTPSGAGGTRKADLLIHQNLPSPPTVVPVEGEVEDGGPPAPPPPSVGDLVFSRSGVRCLHLRGGAIVNQQPRDALQIFVSLRFVDAPDQPQSVWVSARSNLGPGGQTRGVVEGERLVALALEPNDYGRHHMVIVTVDPTNEVHESNEDNNRLRVRVDLPRQPGSPRTLICRPA
jgi:hypothetical protein